MPCHDLSREYQEERRDVKYVRPHTTPSIHFDLIPNALQGERRRLQEPPANQIDLSRRWRCARCFSGHACLLATFVGHNAYHASPTCNLIDPLPELIAQLAQETYSTDLLYHVLLNIQRLDFESRKDVVQIFNTLLRRQIGSRFPTVEYLCNKPEVLFTAFRGYENEDVALNTGMILKEMLRHEPLAKLLLHSEE